MAPGISSFSVMAEITVRDAHDRMTLSKTRTSRARQKHSGISTGGERQQMSAILSTFSDIPDSANKMPDFVNLNRLLTTASVRPS